MRYGNARLRNRHFLPPGRDGRREVISAVFGLFGPGRSGQPPDTFAWWLPFVLRVPLFDVDYAKRRFPQGGNRLTVCLVQACFFPGFLCERQSVVGATMGLLGI
jgi:hypothetical protein